MLGGIARQRLPTRIDHDQLGAAFGRVLDEGRGDRMIDRRIGANHDNDFGVHRSRERGRHRAGIQAFHQCRNRRGMAQPRAVVYIVGAKTGAYQFLEQIRLLVRALGRAEAGERFHALLVADLDEALGGDVERFIPGRFAEMRERIGGIDLVVGILLRIRQPHQRLGQPMRMMDVVEAEAALDAEPVVIGGSVAALGIDDLLVLDLIGDLTADAAERAQRVHLPVRIGDAGLVFIEHHGWHQRASRTGLHTFAAGHAG